MGSPGRWKGAFLRARWSILNTPETVSKVSTATAWLHTFLLSGPKTLREVQDQSWTHGFPWLLTVHAARTLGVRKHIYGTRSETWQLPSEEER